MASGSPFQFVGAAEDERRAAILVRDFGTVSKSISADLSPRRETVMTPMWRADSRTNMVYRRN